MYNKDPEIKNYIEKLLKEIRFFPVKKEIEDEYSDHIEDKVQALITEEEMTRKEALDLTMKEMGDPHEIGKSLNKVHNPLLGWALSITWALLIIFGAFAIHYFISIGSGLLLHSTRDSGIEEHRVIAEVSIDQEIQIDEVTHYFDRAVIQNNGDAYILIESVSYTRQPRARPLLFNSVYDDLGNIYSNHSIPYRSRIFRNDSVLQIRNFDEDAESLTLEYNRYNREFEVIFLLPERSDTP